MKDALKIVTIGGGSSYTPELMKAMEECVIEAALTGDYGLALEAFALNPLIRSGREGKRGLLKMGGKLFEQMLKEFEEYHTNGFPVHFYKTEPGSDSGLIGAVELLF